MNQAGCQAKRVTKQYRQTIRALPEKVFPLLCPVREMEWLDGWHCTMIYSESGLVEEGAVFSTPGEGEPETVWIVTKHDPVNHEVEFTRITHNSRTCVLKIVVHPKDENSSYVDISYTYTGISESGNRFIDELTQEAFCEEMKFWEDSVNYFLKTEKQLKKA
ncbi:MAG: hypothetical protein PVJ84_22685 [Desulfobacteraceae bacterium]|jgi:hypothetical protein